MQNSLRYALNFLLSLSKFSPKFYLPTMINIVLLDPYPVVQKGFKTFFENLDKINLLESVCSVEALFDTLKNRTVDVVITEMELQDVSPVRLIRSLKDAYPKLKVIIFTTLPKSIYELSLLKAGATGFISKKVAPEVMIEAIEKAAENDFHITTNFANEITRNIDVHKPRNAYGTLSSREIEVLKYLIDGKRNIEIAELLKINQKTVNTYKRRVMKKLDVKNLVNLYKQVADIIPVH